MADRPGTPPGTRKTPRETTRDVATGDMATGDMATGDMATGGMATRDMDRWLGDGGMPLIGALGATFERYGVDGEDLGWVEGSFSPEALACNPHGTVQAGVHSVLFDAAMNFAVNAALRSPDRTRGTLELKTETMRAAVAGGRYSLRADVTRLARQVAFAEALLRDADRRVVSRATGTFLLDRRGTPSA